MMNRNLVYVVGLGPGNAQFLTAQARAALQNADVLCGYTVYIDLVRPLFPEKEVYATGMTREIDRCRWALEKAQRSKTVALVCSGDAGVYGMASPLLELAGNYPDVEVEIVPGLTAALSGGAVLGAPLAHDFCVISLSDRLTPWAVIGKRLACAAAGDFCVALYNPSSKGRADYLAKAVRVLLANGKHPETVCGIVRNIGRDGQTARLLTLAELESTPVDMFTTVYIGNDATQNLNGNGDAQGVSRRMNVVIFSGTTEGRALSCQVAALGAAVTVCVATDIGAEEQGNAEGITVCAGRLTADEMAALLRGAALCVDATHPYATEATRNIRAAAQAVGVEYHRLLRPASALPAGSVTLQTAAQAAAYLADKSGNVLLTTGAKELPAFAVLDPARLYPRVLPTLAGITACEAAGIPHRNILAMQGPFTQELNAALLRQFRISYMVTKDGGVAGGFAEKAEAAAQCGVQLIVLRRPEEQGESAETILQRCREIL